MCRATDKGDKEEEESRQQKKERREREHRKQRKEDEDDGEGGWETVRGGVAIPSVSSSICWHKLERDD